MATAGKRLLTAAGKRNLSPSTGKQRNSDGDDTCDAGCCWDFAGQTSVSVTFAGCAPCACRLGGGLASILSGTFGGTFTLLRTGFGTFPVNNCQYEATITYTTVTYDLYEDASFRPGGDASGTSTCADTIICSTNRLHIKLTSTAVNTWRLTAELFNNNSAANCECGNAGDGTGFPIDSLVQAFVFWADGITLDFCGGTVEVDNEGTCTDGSEPLCDQGFSDPNDFATVAEGGTAVITLP